MTMHGIPTRYGGITFRSKNEARWAAFFDRLGWRWEYEIVEADGYLPDFVLLGPAPVVVEVKPDLSVEALCAYTDRIDRALREVWSNDVLIVGATPFPDIAHDDDLSAYGVLGLLGETIDPAYVDEGDDPGPWWWSTACWHLCTAPHCGRHSFHHDLACYQSRLCGHYDGDGYLGEPSGVLEAWRAAGETVRWCPRGSSSGVPG